VSFVYTFLPFQIKYSALIAALVNYARIYEKDIFTQSLVVRIVTSEQTP
jgi:hypothetical protein